MTNQMKWDLKVTLVIIIIAVIAMCWRGGCEKKCPKGEVMIQGKCYIPGAYYNNSGQRVL